MPRCESLLKEPAILFYVCALLGDTPILLIETAVLSIDLRSD
jgi:hypothetical protein